MTSKYIVYKKTYINKINVYLSYEVHYLTFFFKEGKAHF